MALDILIAGKYRLGRKLGGGSFGEIFLGTNLQTGEEVGIKLVRTVVLLSSHHSTEGTSMLPSRIHPGRMIFHPNDGHPSIACKAPRCCSAPLQESVKARHPQLLYESKLYKILQGGGMRGLQPCSVL
jgi:serine/threonine protein kinase